ncbi:MAG: nicotinate (nicotinamide) nucleotide adenylyltransferase [Burkholderiaceae bacterium]|jgi:nicotinate-nucleotide adenylyltransferase|nr:nicotinate (nicotinamide) nucleotide adenylyltransferase [Burkholderiaceae bacterium]
MQCIVLLGGSFDPVHSGHVTIAEHVCQLLGTRQLRLVPAGNPWQKTALIATPEQRIAMLEIAFEASTLAVTIDLWEIANRGQTYSIDYLPAIREKTGKDVSLVFVVGADQLLNFHTWRQWEVIFEYVHVLAVSRPGFDVSGSTMDRHVWHEFSKRLSMPQEIRSIPSGMTYLDGTTHVNISSTGVRDQIAHFAGHPPSVPPKVLDYIFRNNLYRP